MTISEQPLQAGEPPENPPRWRRIALVGGAVIVLAAIGGGMFFAGKSDDPKSAQERPAYPNTEGPTPADLAEASSVTSSFFSVAGNYGLAQEVFEDPAAAQKADHSTESPAYKSRAMATVRLTRKFFDPAAIYNVYSYKDDEAYVPYRVATTVKVIDAVSDGSINGRDSIQVEADLTSSLDFYGQTQGYLDKQGNPHPPVTVKVSQTYTADTAYVTLVEINGVWRVNKVDGLDEVRILAFQDNLEFHEDYVLGLPEPDKVDRTPIT